MSLASGTRVGPYEVVAPLGAGGMGEIYRARDTKLGRDVAIKVLSEGFIHDPERGARFQREAQLLASLNHPHIATIHGLEESGGSQFLVMELVEGETLAERLKSGALAVPEALVVARQVADALQAAHEKGIIHRDLKPANIAFTATGQIKVLDFGLAKALSPAEGGSAVDSPALMTHSPTLSLAATQAGVILGTAAYMAPEQARGKAADKRCDVWAFGCVLYEMLAGTRAFEGLDMADTLAAVLRSEPDWNALPAATPTSIRALVRGCLEKDRQTRIADIAAALFALKDTVILGHGEGPAEAGRSVRGDGLPFWRRAMPIAAAVVVASVITGSIVWLVIRSTTPTPRVSRFTISLPNVADMLSINGFDRDLALTPDGSRLVYVGNKGTQLFVRALDALEPVAIFNGPVRMPFVSPDGQWVGFIANNATVRKVAISGGPAVILGGNLDGNPRGATWGPDDSIVFATNATTTGLQRLEAAGGPMSVLTRPDRAQGEGDHLWPEMLPGGRAVLFTITALAGGLNAAQVAVLDLQTGARKVLVRGGSHAHYVPSGHLVYAAAGTLRAVVFDLPSLETRGTPVPVIPDVVTTDQGGADAVVAGDGTLAYVSGGLGADAWRLVWVDRHGKETPIPVPPHAYRNPRLSPDGTRAVVNAADQENDNWLWDVNRMTLTRVTFDPSADGYPVWTPDGRRLIFASERAGARNVFWQAADGTGTVERLTESPNTQYPTAVSPDGTRLIFWETSPKTRDDILQVQLDGTRRVTALVQSPFTERNAAISPEGRWLAYEADDSGEPEIYVRPYPDVNSGHWQVSTGGGTRPLWGPNGQELFYLSRVGALMRVGVARSQLWAAATPATLLNMEGWYLPGGTNNGRSYDVSPDGQRFLFVKRGETDQAAVPTTLIVVQNWTEELKRLVPVN